MIFLGTAQGAQCPDFEEISTMPPPLNKRKGHTQKDLLHPSDSAVGFRMRRFWGVPHRPATERSSAPARGKNTRATRGEDGDELNIRLMAMRRVVKNIWNEKENSQPNDLHYIHIGFIGSPSVVSWRGHFL